MTIPPRLDGAPGHRWQPRADGKFVCLWIARRDIVKDGYTPKTQRIWPPTATPDAALDDAAMLYIRSECTRLQDDMHSWSKGGKNAMPTVFDGTIDGLIECYKSDPDSDFQKLRFKSRETYSKHLKQVSKTVGRRELAKITGRDFKRWFENWADNDQHIPRAHYRMTMLRLIISFGVGILENPHCIRLNTILGEHKYEGGASRKSVVTAEQTIAIRREAHAIGRPALALAEALKFDLMLRPKDVIGEWVPTAEPGISAVIRGGDKWLYGLDWVEVDDDLVLAHRISKSLRGKKAIVNKEAGKIKRFRLRLYPMVMQELALMLGVDIADVRRDMFPVTDPVVVNSQTGLPYISGTHREHWRSAATKAGVPKSVQNRDSRAGAATEAEELGMDTTDIQKALGHARPKTTQIYTRGADAITERVAEFRATKRPENKLTNSK